MRRARTTALPAALLLALMTGVATAGGVVTPPTAQLTAPPAHDAAARAAVAALPRATAVNDRDGDKLFDEIEHAFAAAPQAAVPALVSFVSTVTTGEGLRAVAAAAPQVRPDRSFWIVPAFAAHLTEAEARAIARVDVVRQIELDSPGRPELETATESMGADAVVDGMGITGSLDGDVRKATGADVSIAILDTGFNTAHSDLRGRLLTFLDVGTGNTTPSDNDGHGTHVASIALGNGIPYRIQRGVAPGAALVGLKITGSSTAESNALAGYEWIVRNREQYNIRVSTMSFGFGSATDGTTALDRAVDKTWDAGIVCFKSAGNSGPGLRTMTVPGSARGILAVGSLLDPGGLRGTVPQLSNYGFWLSTFSSRGPTSDGRIKPDLLAPGESITAARAGTASGYTTLSGTSMASPFAAGVAALAIAANPSLAPDDVRQVLYATAEDWGPPGPDPDFGYGRIRALDAVGEAVRRSGSEPPPVTPPAVPTHTAHTGAGPVFSGSFEVIDTTHPVGITVISSDAVADIVVTDPSGLRVMANEVRARGSRHVNVGFDRPIAGTYRFTVVSGPGALTVDVSAGTA